MKILDIGAQIRYVNPRNIQSDLSKEDGGFKKRNLDGYIEIHQSN